MIDRACIPVGGNRARSASASTSAVWTRPGGASIYLAATSVLGTHELGGVLRWTTHPGVPPLGSPPESGVHETLATPPRLPTIERIRGQGGSIEIRCQMRTSRGSDRFAYGVDDTYCRGDRVEGSNTDPHQRERKAAQECRQREGLVR